MGTQGRSYHRSVGRTSRGVGAGVRAGKSRTSLVQVSHKSHPPILVHWSHTHPSLSRPSLSRPPLSRPPLSRPSLSRLSHSTLCMFPILSRSILFALPPPFEQWWLEWESRIERWWLLTPFRKTLESCAKGVHWLGKHLARDLTEKVEESLRRSPPPPGPHERRRLAPTESATMESATMESATMGSTTMGSVIMGSTNPTESSPPTTCDGVSWADANQLGLPEYPELPRGWGESPTVEERPWMGLPAAQRAASSPFPIPTIRLLPRGAARMYMQSESSAESAERSLHTGSERRGTASARAEATREIETRTSLPPSAGLSFGFAAGVALGAGLLWWIRRSERRSHRGRGSCAPLEQVTPRKGPFCQ